MKNHLYKTALAVALGLAGATAAHAQINNNDLVLGFTSQFSGVTEDYILDLGQIPTSPGVFNTSSTFSPTTFASLFTTSSGNALSSGAVNVGIVGGNQASPSDVIDSTLDLSGTPSTTSPGSSSPGAANPSTIGSASAVATSLALGTPLQSNPDSFYSGVAENPNTVGANGVSSYSAYVSNPLSTINGGTESIVLDLWEDSDSGRSGTTGWTYEGYVDLNLSGGDLTASFDELTPVPEPSTYGLYAVGGLLMLALRRRFAKVA